MVPGKGWWTILRLYNPLQPFFDKSWRPSVDAKARSGAGEIVAARPRRKRGDALQKS
jgi:hypothetical protein